MTDLGNNNIATSKMTGVLPANSKRTNKGRFCRAKTFIRNKEGDRLTASWSAIEKQETEKKKKDKTKNGVFSCSGTSSLVRVFLEIKL